MLIVIRIGYVLFERDRVTEKTQVLGDSIFDDKT